MYLAFVSDSLNGSIRLVKELVEWLALGRSGLSQWTDNIEDVI